ncbi:MAG: serine/threonine protein kinase [Planctomycetota bacterium]|nr:MAG: serine/threonine protein kinase [Planctomycetota bacterium]
MGAFRSVRGAWPVVQRMAAGGFVLAAVVVCCYGRAVRGRWCCGAAAGSPSAGRSGCVPNHPPLVDRIGGCDEPELGVKSGGRGLSEAAELEKVGPYVIEKKLGAGGMGTVYLARHEQTGERCAVKVLPASLAREPGFVQRFAREIDALRKVESPHVVKIRDSGVDHDTYWYAMEYVEGETLTARLRREKRLPWRDAVDIAVQVCKALKAAHNAGIIHRDLKPSNLMITRDGTVKLMDFGVAQVFAATRLTVTGGIVGTAEYMSPEQAEGRRTTKRSDLYSLGAVLYVMVTGRPPFTGKTALDFIQKHRFGRFDRPSLYVPDIPRQLDELICQLLEKDPEKRPPDAYVLQRRLEEIPKIVALQEDFTLDGEEVDGVAPTVAVSRSDAAADRDIGPGQATLMHNLMRAEIEVDRIRGERAWWNNTWVLVAGLVLVTGVAVLFGARQRSPQERFQQGVALMEKGPGPNYLEARDEYFLPLLEEDRATWEPKVRPYLERVEAYERNVRIRRQMGIRRPRDYGSEAERLLAVALRDEEAGRYPEAERKLEALLALIGDDPKQQAVAEVARQTLRSLRERRAAGAESDALARRGLQRADQLLKQGDRQGAERIWRAIIELYGDDPAAAQWVSAARSRLAKQATADED